MKERLGSLELVVLKRIWDHGGGSVTVKEIWEPIYRERGLAYTTVGKVMKNLEAKGYLSHEEKDRAYYYSPIVRQEDVSGSMLRDLLLGLYGGSAARLVAALVRTTDFDRRELDEIERIIVEEKGGERDDGATPGSAG